MTRDDIAQMMQDSSGNGWGTEAHFQRFAALVAAAAKEEEREACCQIVYGYCGSDNVAARTVEAIKARGT